MLSCQSTSCSYIFYLILQGAIVKGIDENGNLILELTNMQNELLVINSDKNSFNIKQNRVIVKE